jgi:hypothetical protein
MPSSRQVWLDRDSKLPQSRRKRFDRGIWMARLGYACFDEGCCEPQARQECNDWGRRPFRCCRVGSNAVNPSHFGAAGPRRRGRCVSPCCAVLRSKVMRFSMRLNDPRAGSHRSRRCTRGLCRSQRRGRRHSGASRAPLACHPQAVLGGGDPLWSQFRAARALVRR